AETVDVRAPETFLPLPVEDGEPITLSRKPIRDLAGSVGRVVVDHEHVDVMRLERLDHALEVLALVVGGQADDRARHGPAYDRRVAELPRIADIAEQIDLLGDLLELEGKDTFRVVAYRRAAARVRETSGSVAQLALDGRAKELQGIGKTIEEKIVQI